MKIETHGTWLRFSCRAICLRYRFEAWVIQQYPNARTAVSKTAVYDTNHTASDIAHRGNCNVHISLWCCRRGVKIICYGFIHKAKNRTNLIYSKPLNDTIQQETQVWTHLPFCRAKWVHGFHPYLIKIKLTFSKKKSVFKNDNSSRNYRFEKWFLRGKYSYLKD